jgi:flavin-dependent dehydrogenase
MVVENAISAGAEFFEGMEAIRPLHDDNSEIQGALVINHETSEELEIKAKFLAVADGANSRFGRSLGSNRNKSYPMGMAIRGYFESPLDKEPWIESALDVKDRNGNSMPGYGWIFPVGNGTINVGIGLLSTFRDYREVNTTHLFNEFALTLPDYWDINPLTPIEPPTGGRLPMAGSVGPKAGHNWLLVGDAAGSVNPFNGEGIDYAYETGRLAASLFVEANLQHDNKVLQRYPDLLDEEYGLYFKVARLFAKIIGNPVLIRELTRVGMHSQTLMEWALKVMANLMKENDKGLDEAAYGMIASIVKMIPDQRVSK